MCFVHDTKLQEQDKNPYKSLVCLTIRSLNTRYAMHTFYVPRDPTSMQFKQQSTVLIFIITIRETTDIFAMIVAVIQVRNEKLWCKLFRYLQW